MQLIADRGKVQLQHQIQASKRKQKKVMFRQEKKPSQDPELPTSHLTHLPPLLASNVNRVPMHSGRVEQRMCALSA
jgi:hypothetical protein